MASATPASHPRGAGPGRLPTGSVVLDGVPTRVSSRAVTAGAQNHGAPAARRSPPRRAGPKAERKGGGRGRRRRRTPPHHRAPRTRAAAARCLPVAGGPPAPCQRHPGLEDLGLLARPVRRDAPNAPGERHRTRRTGAGGGGRQSVRAARPTGIAHPVALPPMGPTREESSATAPCARCSTGGREAGVRVNRRESKGIAPPKGRPDCPRRSRCGRGGSGRRSRRRG